MRWSMSQRERKRECHQTRERHPGSTRVQSVERAAAVLRAVAAADGPAGSATALAEAVGLNRTTTWRILTTLEHERLVTHDAETGTYSLGFGLIDLAGRAGGASLVRSSRVVLQHLAAQARETAALAMVRGGVLTYVAEATADAVVAAGWQGREVAMHATSTGKVLLAYSHPADVRMLLNLPRGRRLHPVHPDDDHLADDAREGARNHPRPWVRRVSRRVREHGVGGLGTRPRCRRESRRRRQRVGSERTPHRGPVRGHRQARRRGRGADRGPGRVRSRVVGRPCKVSAWFSRMTRSCRCRPRCPS